MKKENYKIMTKEDLKEFTEIELNGLKLEIEKLVDESTAFDCYKVLEVKYLPEFNFISILIKSITHYIMQIQILSYGELRIITDNVFKLPTTIDSDMINIIIEIKNMAMQGEFDEYFNN